MLKIVFFCCVFFIFNFNVEAGWFSNYFSNNIEVKIIKDQNVSNDDLTNKFFKVSTDILNISNNIVEEMSDRILETQRIQNINIKLTQKNLLETQKNFNFVLENRYGIDTTADYNSSQEL